MTSLSSGTLVSVPSDRVRAPEVYIDLGANMGDTVRAHFAERPQDTIIAVEANAVLIPNLARIFLKLGIRGTVINAAAWTKNGIMDFFLGHHESSTVLRGKVVPPSHSQPIDYQRPVCVPCIDFSQMISDLSQANVPIIVKMDIEGAEYEVCEWLLHNGTMALIRDLYCEWHWDRFPERFTRQQHDAVVTRVRQETHLHDWH